MKTPFDKVEKLTDSLSFIFEKIKMLPLYKDAVDIDKFYFVALVRKKEEYTQIRKIISELKNDLVFLKNYEPNSIIFMYEGLKISIFLTQDEYNFEWMYGYRSFFSAPLIGKLLKKAGLKYSPEGVQYTQYDLRKNHHSLVGVINITKEFKRICGLLQYDYDRILKGFENQEEFFHFILTTPYIKIEKFLEAEDLGKSSIFDAFAQFLVTNKITKTDYNKYKSFTFEITKEYFSEIDFDKKIEELREKAEKKLNLTQKFNGKTILENIPNFNPKFIAPALGRFKYSFGDVELFKEFIIENSVEDIISKFKKVNSIELYGIYYGDREYAHASGDPLLEVVEAHCKEEAERISTANGNGAGLWAVSLSYFENNGAVYEAEQIKKYKKSN